MQNYLKPSSSQEQRLKSLVDKFEEGKRVLAGLEGQKQALDILLKQQMDEVEESRNLDVSYQKLQKFFQTMGTDEQIKLQKWFEHVVTYGLQCVFNNFRFVITGPEVRSNEIAIGFKIVERVKDDDQERDPYEECGGGVADVLSFLLQFVMVFLLRDRINPVLFLDESAKYLSVDLRPAFANLLKELVEKTEVQIVLITHEPLFVEAADVAYEFSHNGVETIASRLK